MNYMMNIILTLSVALGMCSCAQDKYLTYNENTGEEERPGEEVINVPRDMRWGEYTLRTSDSDRHQVIRGLGFEIQPDDFGPTYENGDPVRGVPHDLVESERERFANEILKGFRYMRVAMGLWFRGMSDDRKNFVNRYEDQAEGLVALMKDAGVEGISMEYWSPAPYWKTNDKLVNGMVKKTDDEFLDQFTDALVKDIRYLRDKGMKICTWGLQNEPNYLETSYSHCHYEPDTYVKVFKKIAPKVKELDPSIEIILDSGNGNVSTYAAELRKSGNSEYLKYVDAWVYHRIGDNSDYVMQRSENYKENSMGKPIYQNEFEYFQEQVQKNTKEWMMVNTAQSIMNWMTFLDSPTWYWLHALKPVSDLYNRDGFGMGVWREPSAKQSYGYPDLKVGHFQMFWWNWHPIAGFLKYMPWDSVRYTVDEKDAKTDNRIMAWKTPEGKFAMAVTNRSDDWYEFRIGLDGRRAFKGYSFDSSHFNRELGKEEMISKDASLSAKVKPWSIVFLVEE